MAALSRPSVLAVLRLITNSNLVGCSTGRSAGLAPLRIFPVYMASLAICIANVGSVAHQTTGGDELTREVNRRDRVARRQRYELKAPTEENRIGHNKKQTDPLLDEASEGAVNVLVGAGVQDMEL